MNEKYCFVFSRSRRHGHLHPLTTREKVSLWHLSSQAASRGAYHSGEAKELHFHCVESVPSPRTKNSRVNRKKSLYACKTHRLAVNSEHLTLTFYLALLFIQHARHSDVSQTDFSIEMYEYNIIVICIHINVEESRIIEWNSRKEKNAEWKARVKNDSIGVRHGRVQVWWWHYWFFRRFIVLMNFPWLFITSHNNFIH